MANPAKLFSRQKLFELVWERPMRELAAELDISDVGLAKHCKRADIPIPPRGYFLQKDARKRIRPALPLRFPGGSDQIWLGGRHYGYWPHYTEQELLDLEEPPIPTFRESLEEVSARIERMMGPVRSVKNFDRAFGDISKLLAIDEERRKSSWSFETPRYDAGPQRRRLLLLNALFLGLHGLGCRPSMTTSKYAIDDPEHRSISVQVGAQQVAFTLEAPNFDRHKRPMKFDSSELQLVLGYAGDKDASPAIWSDAEGKKLESQLREIVVAIILKAEQQHRDSAHRMRDWVIERKQQLITELKRREAERVRLEQERKENEERARIKDLLRQADNLRKASTIRDYVSAVSERVPAASLDRPQLESWMQWARAVADRLDPTLHMANYSLDEESRMVSQEADADGARPLS